MLKIGDLVGGNLQNNAVSALKGAAVGKIKNVAIGAARNALGGLIGSVAVGAVIGVVGNLTSALFMTGRTIGGIVPDVTIEEHHEDTLEITRHPVEQGAAITDHAYKNPSEVTMRVAWSNSSLALNGLLSGSLFSSGLKDINDLYRQFLELQESRQVFDVVTGKRTYNNMLIKSVAETTDHNTENCLILTVRLQQIIIVETETVVLQPAEDHAAPQDTAAPQNAGTKQPITAVKQSALKVLAGAIQ